jgi:hypothetical protein
MIHQKTPKLKSAISTKVSAIEGHSQRQQAVTRRVRDIETGVEMGLLKILKSGHRA